MREKIRLVDCGTEKKPNIKRLIRIPDDDCLNLCTRRGSDLYTLCWRARQTFFITNVAEGNHESVLQEDKNGKTYATYFRRYNTDHGNGLELRYYPEDDTNSPIIIPAYYAFITLIRTAKGYVECGELYTDIDKAIVAGSKLRGAPVKKSKKQRQDPKAKERQRWWSPRQTKIVVDGDHVYSTALLRNAWCKGFCTIDQVTCRLKLDVSDPDVKNVFFLIEVSDYYNRTFYVLLQEDGDKFMVAIKHNPKIIKPTGVNKLFSTGNNPFSPGDLNLTDMELLHAAVRTLAG